MTETAKRTPPIDIPTPRTIICRGGRGGDHVFARDRDCRENSCGTVYCRCGAEVHRRGAQVVAGHDPACGRAGDAEPPWTPPLDLQCERGHIFQADAALRCGGGCGTVVCRCGAEVHRRGRWILAGHDPICRGQNKSL